ncbi:MAG: LysR family transcriptional regulator [Rhodospirillales bacterium]|nr:LysR family transcriptional regulator [Rhodospirillales bacterium]
MRGTDEIPTEGVDAPDDGAPAMPNRDGSGASWNGIDLNLLVVFDAIMQDRTLTRAARRLGQSQPTASHALNRLRTMLHDELFIRGPDGMRPTPRAEQMAGPVREALSLCRIALEPDTFDPRSSRRDFTIVVNNFAARAVIPGLVRRVAIEAPGIGLDVRPIGRLNVLDTLDSDAADLALCLLGEGGERFKCVRVMEDDYVAVLDRAHPAARLALTPARLAELPHVALTSSGDDTSFLDRALAERGLARRVAARVPFLSLALLLVGSDYVAVMPRRIATDLAALGPLTVKDLPFASPWISVSLIWHRRLDAHPAQRWLRDVIRSVADS